MVGILGAVLLAVLGTSVLQSQRIDQVFHETNQSNASVHDATYLAYQTQVHFKKQVQEWKNILLRGSDERELVKYSQQFQTQAEKVRRLTIHLLTALPPDSEPWRSAKAFSRAHDSLELRYSKALRLFLEDRSDPFRIDAIVRGLDREPTDLLDKTMAAVASYRKRSLKNGIIALAAARRNAFFARAVVFLVAMLFTLWALRRWVHQPIVVLTTAARKIADGNLGMTIDVDAHGHLGALGATFNQMSGQLADLVEQVRSNTTLEKELEIAETVQAALIPAPTVHQVSGLEISGRYVPASRCGGDWWSYFRVSEHETLVLVGDVTGHGVPTTLITASVNACCKEICQTTDEMRRLKGSSDRVLRSYLDERSTLHYVLRHLNESILRVGHGRFLMTFSAALIDTRTRVLTCASAGHEAPLLIRGDASGAIEPVFSGPSLRLGECVDPRFVEVSLSLAPNDTVVWYTDGLVDILGPKQKAYGDGRLLRTLRKNREAGVDGIAQRVLDDVRRFGPDSSRTDDMTIVVARVVETVTQAETRSSVDCAAPV